ncbi:tetratricopeptide repeat protein [Lyngbya confervoides]|uniref:Tetratricopeptide repeat protein n=1 Tax=Lyngbya confervoides BDU141951 TaxID=1574623 RepID=A0ABD4T9C2_9CYAN|nr:tetratricopeptide repeat protein [Lyngbya confervoides]MCM1985177.1 tetratricopeptide repeat protein [Lyngbya confervoides BDU141951]
MSFLAPQIFRYWAVSTLVSVWGIGVVTAAVLAQQRNLLAQDLPIPQPSSSQSLTPASPDLKGQASGSMQEAASPSNSGADREENPPASSSTNTVSDLVKQADQLYVQGQFAQAIEQYSQALNLYPENAYALYNRANAWRRMKKDTEAIADYTAALRYNPTHAFSFLYRGEIYAALGETEKAVADFSAGLRLTDQNPALYVARAHAYSKLGESEAAKKDMRRAIDLYEKQGKERQATLLKRKLGSL